MAAASQALRFNDGFPRPDKHMPGLDCLRGVAIVAVLLCHGVPNIGTHYAQAFSPAQLSVFAFFTYGIYGVHLFFVLSGFLITGILLDTRTRSDYYKNFYIRRALRILPALLLTILVLRATNQMTWTFFFLALFFVANLGLRYGGGGAGAASALWTLSVEEQFYLFWPTVIRKLKPIHSFYVALVTIALNPVLRWALQTRAHPIDTYFKTWGVLDFFAGGAALAIMIRSSRTRPKLPMIQYALYAAAAVLALVHWAVFPGSLASTPLANATYFCPMVFLFSACVLSAFLHPGWQDSWVGKGLIFFGYISYSLYLYHKPIFNFFESHWLPTGTTSQELLPALVLRFAAEAGVSILLAWASRSTFEAYFLKLKPRKHETLKDVSVAV